MCAGGMKDVRQQFDWPAGLIDRVSSLMRCRKKKTIGKDFAHSKNGS